MTHDPHEPAFQEQLLAYYFGTLSGEERQQLESQLLESQEALAAYMALKRAMDFGEGDGALRPSADAKARLFAAVEQRYAPTPWRRLTRWLRIPIPLYQGLVACGLLLALLFGSLYFWTPPQRQDSIPHSGALIDTASEGSEQLDWS